jgi:hypothetical protein
VIVPILCQQMEAFVAMKRLFEVKLNWSRWWICACQRHFWPEKMRKILTSAPKIRRRTKPLKDCQWRAKKVTSFIKPGKHKESWESQLFIAILGLIWSLILPKLWKIYWSYP